MSLNPIVIPEKYKLPARGFLEALDKRLGSRQATAEFILEAGKPLAEAHLGTSVTRETAKLVLAAAIDAIYTDARPAPVGTPPAVTLPTRPPVTPAVDDFAGIKKFRNSADCSKWPVTVQISNVRIEGKNIAWDEVKGQRETRKWNVKTGRKSINGETILVIPSRGEAGMFDYLGVGQTRKILSNLYPGHEGQGFFAPWQPTRGEKCGFCIATISRDRSAAEMQERSNVVWFTWP